MAIGTNDSNLIQQIPDIMDRLTLLESGSIVPIPNLAFLLTLGPDNVLEGTEITDFQSLQLLVDNVAILDQITSLPSMHVLLPDELTAIQNIANSAVHSDLMAFARVRQTDFDLHTSDLNIHHTHTNRPILENITNEGSGQIITNIERTNLNTIYSDYLTNLPTGFPEVRSHIDTTGDLTIHHTHANKTILDNVLIDTLVADETLQYIRIGKLQICYGNVTVSVGNLQAKAHYSAGPLLITFPVSFISLPSFTFTIEDLSVHRNGGWLDADVRTTVAQANLDIINTSDFMLYLNDITIRWMAIGQWQL